MTCYKSGIRLLVVFTPNIVRQAEMFCDNTVLEGLPSRAWQVSEVIVNKYI